MLVAENFCLHYRWEQGRSNKDPPVNMFYQTNGLRPAYIFDGLGFLEMTCFIASSMGAHQNQDYPSLLDGQGDKYRTASAAEVHGVASYNVSWTATAFETRPAEYILDEGRFAEVLYCWECGSGHLHWYVH